jgi:hypothetical protein
MFFYAGPHSVQNNPEATAYFVECGTYGGRVLFLRKDGLLYPHVLMEAPSPQEVKAVQDSLDRERATLFTADPALAEYFPPVTVYA